VAADQKSIANSIKSGASYLSRDKLANMEKDYQDSKAGSQVGSKVGNQAKSAIGSLTKSRINAASVAASAARKSTLLDAINEEHDEILMSSPLFELSKSIYISFF
jgi:hypothetical protein